MDIQSFFPFFRITNKPRSAFEHFGAISPSRDSKRKNHSLMKWSQEPLSVPSS
jgi:hypothetical protein